MEEFLPDQYVYEDGKCFIVEQFVEKHNLSTGVTVFEDIFEEDPFEVPESECCEAGINEACEEEELIVCQT